jgi:hypothetical protein
MNTDTSTTDPVVHRSLNPAWGAPEELEALRALRAERRAEQERDLAAIELARSHERAARRAGSDARRHGRHRVPVPQLAHV